MKRLKQASNLQEAMIEVVEVLHSNLQADPDLSGLIRPYGDAELGLLAYRSAPHL